MAWVCTAVAAAVELGTAAAICVAITDVGLALTVVGAVTGNKECLKIGGMMSLAGGVGSLAVGAVGMFGEVASEAVVKDVATSTATDLATTATTDATQQLATDTLANTATDTALSAPGSTLTDAATGQAATFQAPGALAAPGAPGLGGGIPVDPNAAVTDSLIQKAPGSALQAPTAGDGMLGGATDPTGAMIGDGSATAGQQAMDALRNKQPMTGQLKDWFDSQSPATKDTLLKSALSIPGGIQNQMNADRNAGMRQQEIDNAKAAQTNKGVPTWGTGIINRAKGG